MLALNVTGLRTARSPSPSVDQRFQSEPLRQLHALADRVDRTARHPGPVEGDEQVVGRPLAQSFDEQRMQLVAVAGAIGIEREARIVGDLGDPEHLAQRSELAVVGGGDDHVAVVGRHRLVRVHAGMGIAHPVRHDAGGGKGTRLVDEPRQRRGQQADFDVLTETGLLSLVERSQHADQPVQPGHHVEQGDAGAEGRPVRLTGETHQPRHGLHDEVVPGQPGALGGAEPADREVHEAGVEGLGGGVVEAELGEAARLEVLDRDVGATQQLACQLDVVRVVEVEHDRLLVAVDREVVRRDAVVLGRAPGPCLVAGRALDLDHGGAHVGQQHRAVRPGQHPRQVGDDQSIERAGGGVHVGSLRNSSTGR